MSLECYSKRAQIEAMKHVLWRMGDVVGAFPTVVDEPRVWLSSTQGEVCAKYHELRDLALPGWVRLSLVAGALVAALADLHSALAAVFSATTPVSGPAGVWAVALALLVHAASKSVTAGLTGGMAYLRWLAPGLWLHTLLGVALLAWWG